MGEDEAEERVFGPVAIVAVAGSGSARKAQWPPWAVSMKVMLRVGVDLVAGLGGEADEGVVERVEDERGHGDAVDDARGGGAVVVVVCAGEAGVERGDAVVEVAEGTDAGGAVGIVGAGKECALRRKRRSRARRNCSS